MKEKTSSSALWAKAKEEVFQYCFSVKLIDTKTFKRLRLLSITKLQNLKAIRNLRIEFRLLLLVVINHKTTKFGSNSQRSNSKASPIVRCYQSQNYKIWKQFTTHPKRQRHQVRLLSITKLQNLKAIHNWGTLSKQFFAVVINHKTTKFESNSEQIRVLLYHLLCCYQSQNYKIWKQFTTHQPVSARRSRVVINHKITKFESNSQRCPLIAPATCSCYQLQNYKIWKQFTTKH